MAKLSIDDLINLDSKELLAKMSSKEVPMIQEEQPTEVAAVEQVDPSAVELPPTPEPQEEAAVGDEADKPPTETTSTQVAAFDKTALKGAFAPDATIFTKGTTVVVGSYNLEVVTVEKSSGRVRFRVLETGEVFSASRAMLTGQQEEMPFKKGDIILFNGLRYGVTGLNPANRNVVIEIDGKKKYIKASKVTLA